MSITIFHRLFGFKSLNASDLTVVITSMYNLAYPSAVLCCIIFCNFQLVSIVFMIHTLHVWVLVTHILSLLSSDLTSSFFFLSSVFQLVFIIMHCPFLTVTVLIVFTAYAKSSPYLYLDIFIILFGLWS